MRSKQNLTNLYISGRHEVSLPPCFHNNVLNFFATNSPGWQVVHATPNEEDHVKLGYGQNTFNMNGNAVGIKQEVCATDTNATTNDKRTSDMGSLPTVY